MGLRFEGRVDGMEVLEEFFIRGGHFGGKGCRGDRRGWVFLHESFYVNV